MDSFSSHRRMLALVALVAMAPRTHARDHAGDVQRGARAAQTCMACHSFTPGQHLTGPSLADILGRKAGTAQGFGRYSQALQRSGIVWDPRELDAWLANPAARVPGTSMSFPGIADDRIRADLIAYLEAISHGAATPPRRELPDLKKGEGGARVTAIHACGDGYRVATADGKTEAFWEFNLRFKTDGSASGPRPGHPVIVRNGMQGDRASVVFAKIEEISAFVRRQCT